MDRSKEPRDPSVIALSGDREAADDKDRPEIEPESWRDLTNFADQFDDAVFGVFANLADGPEGFWIVEEIDKVRPAAVPIDQGPTFDLSILGPGGKVIDEIRLTIEEIEHIRAADPAVPRPKGDDET